MKRKNFLKKPVYGKPIDMGMEGVLKPVRGTKLVHKVFYLDWISRKYSMGGKLEWITKLASSPAMIDFRDVQPPKRGRHGLGTVPAEQWAKITFILAGHTVDVMKAAKRTGIPVPKVFRRASVPGKSGRFFVVELSNLKTPDTVVISGSELGEFHKNTRVKNYQDLVREIERDGEKLKAIGYHYSHYHKPLGAWIIVINKKTMEGRRLLVDATNFLYRNPKK